MSGVAEAQRQAEAVRAVRLARERSLLPAQGAEGATAELEFAIECCVATIADQEQGVQWCAALKAGDLQDEFGELLSYGGAEADAAADFCGELRRACAELYGAGVAAEAALNAPTRGEYCLCEREMPTTRHHLYPRDEHPRLLRRGMHRAALNTTVAMCRPCHDAVHEHISNVDLADQFETVEKLLTHEEVYKFARWASREKVRTLADSYTVLR